MGLAITTAEVTEDLGRCRSIAAVQPVHTGAGGVAGHDGAKPEGEVLGPLSQLAAQRLRLNPAQRGHFVGVWLNGPSVTAHSR